MITENSVLIDLTNLLGLKDNILYCHPQLPGYLKDLKSMKGKLIGLLYEDKQIYEIEKILALFPNLEEFPIVILKNKEDLEAIWAMKRRYDVKLPLCYLVTSNEKDHTVFKDLGVWKFETPPDNYTISTIS
jgi:hypothetical protein